MRADGFCSKSRPLVIPGGWSGEDIDEWRRQARELCPNSPKDVGMINMERHPTKIDILCCGRSNKSHVDYHGWFHILALQPTTLYILPMTYKQAVDQYVEHDSYGEEHICPLRNMTKIQVCPGDIVQFLGIMPHTARSKKVMYFLSHDEVAGGTPRPSKKDVVALFTRCNQDRKSRQSKVVA